MRSKGVNIHKDHKIPSGNSEHYQLLLIHGDLLFYLNKKLALYTVILGMLLLVYLFLLFGFLLVSR